MKEKLKELIRAQQAGKENLPEYMIGEQLLEMAEGDEKTIELLVNDLQIKEMDLSAAAKQLKQYSDANKGKAQCFCITPIVAEKILRKFYGLPDKNEQKVVPAEPNRAEINLDDFFA